MNEMASTQPHDCCVAYPSVILQHTTGCLSKKEMSFVLHAEILCKYVCVCQLLAASLYSTGGDLTLVGSCVCGCGCGWCVWVWLWLVCVGVCVCVCVAGVKRCFVSTEINTRPVSARLQHRPQHFSRTSATWRT